MPTGTSASQIYVDPSALRSLYLHDARSLSMARWRKRNQGALPVTHHGRAELVNSMALAVFRHDITAADLAGAVADLEADFSTGRLVPADLLWRRALDRAASLSLAHTPTLGTRTLDVLHVASALELGCRLLVTYDTRQASLARAVGLRVRAP
jgi:predicted nucleic acid-binding protein